MGNRPHESPRILSRAAQLSFGFLFGTNILPMRMPNRLAPLTLAMPAVSAGFSSPESEAS
jgi:hypothetical protein